MCDPGTNIGSWTDGGCKVKEGFRCHGFTVTKLKPQYTCLPQACTTPQGQNGTECVWSDPVDSTVAQTGIKTCSGHTCP